MDNGYRNERSKSSVNKSMEKTYSRQPNADIDPIEEFDRDITLVPEEALNTEELKYLMRRKIAEHAV